MNGCKARCYRYLQKNQGVWIAKGKICDLARTHGGYTGEMTGRRLRELVTAKEIEVKEVDGHAWYRFTGDDERKRLEAIKWFDALPDSPVRAHNDLQHA